MIVILIRKLDEATNYQIEKNEKKTHRYDDNFVERKGTFSKCIIFELKPARSFEICAP